MYILVYMQSSERLQRFIWRDVLCCVRRREGVEHDPRADREHHHLQRRAGRARGRLHGVAARVRGAPAARHVLRDAGERHARHRRRDRRLHARRPRLRGHPVAAARAHRCACSYRFYALYRSDQIRLIYCKFCVSFRTSVRLCSDLNSNKRNPTHRCWSQYIRVAGQSGL